jgi:hypothetical protein
MCFDGAQLMKSYHILTLDAPSPHPPLLYFLLFAANNPRQAVGLNSNDRRPARMAGPYLLVVPIRRERITKRRATPPDERRGAAARGVNSDPHDNDDDCAAPCSPSSDLNLPHERWSRWWTLHLPSLRWTSECARKGHVRAGDYSGLANAWAIFEIWKTASWLIGIMEMLAATVKEGKFLNYS